MRASTLFIIVLTTLGFVALGFGIHYARIRAAAVPSITDYEEKLKNLDAGLKQSASEIQTLQGESACRSDSECRIHGLGPKICGTYTTYLIYSIRDAVDETKLLAALARFNDMSEEKNRLSYKVLSCGQEPAPVRCIEKRCLPTGPRSK